MAKVKGQPIMPVWHFDEAQEFQQPPRSRSPDEPTWIAQLLSAFVELREHAPLDVLPMCLVSGTQWSASDLRRTGSSKAGVVDLLMLPLRPQHCHSIFSHVCSRISQPAPAAAQPASVAAQPAPAAAQPASVAAQTGHAAAQSASVAAQTGHWPHMEVCLASHPMSVDPPLPDKTRRVLELACGNPRFLAYACDSMAGVSDGRTLWRAGEHEMSWK
jgi:hypothetical protein